MPLTVSFSPFRDGSAGTKVPTIGAFLALALVCAMAPAWGQAPPAAKNPSAHPQLVITSGPVWSELSRSQQKVLAPLAPDWESLEPVRKRKWMAVAQTYPQMAPAEQAKLQARMTEWAALSPRQRTLARLNFSESKKLPTSDRAADWDAYKALPPEDRQKFVEKAASAPKSAALAPKRSTLDKVTQVPVTRHTPTTELGNSSAMVPTLNRKTLLPQTPKPAKAAASSPAN